MTSIPDMGLRLDSDMLSGVADVGTVLQLVVHMNVIAGQLFPHWFHVCPSSGTTSIHDLMSEYVSHRGSGWCQSLCHWMLMVALVESVIIGTVHGTNDVDLSLIHI